MSNTFRTTIPSAAEAFAKGVARIAATSKKEIPEIAASNFGGVVRNLFGLTPPMWASFIRADEDGGRREVNFEQGLAKSNNTIATDVAKGTWTLRGRNKYKNSDMKSAGMKTVRAYLACRNARKRYQSGFGKPISESDQKLLNQVLHNRQGWTAAGWVPAAKYFMAGRIPRWISRHSGSAGGSVKHIVGDKIVMQAFNPTNHVNASGIQARVNIATKMQVNVMNRRFKKYVEQKFKGQYPWA
ncbi:MAG: hypothetical protein ACO265_04675 [Polynucleobacter sp.]